jgi:hypothetical protein
MQTQAYIKMTPLSNTKSNRIAKMFQLVLFSPPVIAFERDLTTQLLCNKMNLIQSLPLESQTREHMAG